MEKKGSALAWGIAVIAVIGFVAALMWGMSLQRRAASLEANVEQAQERTQELKAQAERQVERQTVQIKELEEQLGNVEEQLATILTPPPMPDSPSIGDMMERIAAGEELPAPTEEAAGGGMREMLRMYEGEQGEQMATMGANMAVSMYYGELFEMLDMPAEAEERVRAILGDHLARQIMAGAEMLREQSSPEDSQARQAEMEAALRADLSEVLNETGMGIFDEYQAGFQERGVRQSLNMQIGMFAPNLSPDSRDVVVDVIAEEMLAGVHPETGMTMSGPEPAQQLGALDRSRERLSTVFDEREMASVDRFLEQQRSAIEMAISMMGGRSSEAESAE